MNRYLVSSVIIFALFMILSVVIYTNNTFEILEKSSYESMIYNLDTTPLQTQDKPYSYLVIQLMKFLSGYGHEYFWFVELIVMFLIRGFDGRIVVIVIITSFIIITPLNFIIKDLVDKDRPLFHDFKSVEEIPLDKSYPMDHASLVSASALPTGLSFRHSLNQKLIASFLVIEAGLVSISRLYLRVHYPTDVIGGILLGRGVPLLISSRHMIFERLVKKIRI